MSFASSPPPPNLNKEKDMTLEQLNEKWSTMLKEMYIINPKFKKFREKKHGVKTITPTRKRRIR